MKLKYSDILRLNKELDNNIQSTSYSIIVLSNIVIHQIKEILEYRLRIENINANVELGDYDNIVQDSLKYNSSNVVLVFWELCNIIDGFQYKIELLNNEQLDEIFEKTQLEIDLVLKNIEATSLVLINKFTSLPFSNLNLRKNHLDELAKRLNCSLQEKVSSNIKLVDFDKVISSIGVSNSLDWRYYYSSKVLYTVDFFNNYVEFIKPFIMSTNGKSKKALIFDCDNTLWKGILGEDGFDKIEMSNATKDGAVYAEIQAIALALNKKGVLIGLCSKNNSSDVDEVINSHMDMQLREKHITIKKVNWSEKISNLREISKELNIGLDSFVFVDDSYFEVNLIREYLPEVTVLQVPERLYEYPKMLRENAELFYDLTVTTEDSKKIKMYKQQFKRETSKKKFENIEDYLASLELKVCIFENDNSIIPRISQMSQKTNQFNLTTKRYTETDIQNLINDSNFDIFAFTISDKFGESGITGLSIINYNYDDNTAEIDTLLMSCRIIGRNIEYAFINNVIDRIKEKKYR